MRSSRLASVIRKWRTISACMDGGKMPAYSAQRPAQYYERDVITDWPRGPRPSAKNDEFTRKAQSRGRPIVRAVSRLFIAVLIVNPTLGKGRQCPLWVKSRHLQRKKTCPLCPRKRTCAVQLGMSALCQLRTLAQLFDHLSDFDQQLSQPLMLSIPIKPRMPTSQDLNCGKRQVCFKDP